MRRLITQEYVSDVQQDAATQHYRIKQFNHPAFFNFLVNSRLPFKLMLQTFKYFVQSLRYFIELLVWGIGIPIRNNTKDQTQTPKPGAQF
jgi:hypothetical protein